MQFDQRSLEAGNQDRFVNLLCDSGTIHGVSFLHPAVTNLSCLDDIMILYRLNHGGMLIRLLITVYSFKRSMINFGKTNVSFVG
jgi:hypothetical protein